MRFTISREVLIKPLQLVAGVVEPPPHTCGVSQHIGIGKKRSTIFVGSDAEIEIVAKLPIDSGLELGDTTVPAKSFGHLQKLAGWFQYRFHLR